MPVLFCNLSKLLGFICITTDLPCIMHTTFLIILKPKNIIKFADSSLPFSVDASVLLLLVDLSSSG